MSPFLVLLVTVIVDVNSLCTWNRHAEPDGTDNAGTMNFVNGEWARDASKGALLNGQPYWKKTQQAGCYVPTLYLWYYRGPDIGDYQWIITQSLQSTPSTAYAVCDTGMDPNPATPVKCNGKWLFAPKGQFGDTNTYLLDKDFNVRPNDCPQVLCQSVEFKTNGGDFYEGVFNRDGSNDQMNQNVYVQSNTQSQTNQFYLYFNHEIFKWIVNEVYDTDCQKATSGQLTAVSTVKDWSFASGKDGKSWFFTPVGSSEFTRYIECSGQIPTTSPSKSDAIGEPTPAPTLEDRMCDIFPNQPQCQPTTSAPPSAPTSPTASWPTVPTIHAPDDAGIISYKVYWIGIIFALYQLLL